MPDRYRPYSTDSDWVVSMERRESRDATAGCSWRREHAPVREPSELSADELEEELTIAAYAPGRIRYARFERLLDERRRRLLAV